MKQGKNINEISFLLQDIKDNSHDMIIPIQKLGGMVAEMAYTAPSQRSVSVDDVVAATEDAIGGESAQAKQDFHISVINGSRHSFAPTNWAHNQIADYAAVPREYYNRLLGENKPLLTQNVNHGFLRAAQIAGTKRGNTGRMLRTYRGQVRALLSSRYRRLDCFDLFQAVAPSLIKLGFEPVSLELTDRRLYIKVLSTKITSEVKVGDVVQYGLVISGSDVGEGSVRVEPMVYRLSCKNGMISEAAIRKSHLGANQAGDDIQAMLRDETKAVSDQAFWMQVRDVVENYAKPEFFEAEVNELRAAAGEPIRQMNLPILVERTAKAVGINATDSIRQAILDNLADGAHGAGLTKWGLANAFTFAAQHESLDYDDATKMERAGSKIIHLEAGSWANLNARIKSGEKVEA